MSDRIFAVVVLLFAALMAWAGTQIQESFIQDPLGPKAFPLLISGLMAVSGLVMFFKPDAEPHWPGLFKVLELMVTAAVLVIYAYALPVAGFVASTAVTTSFLSWRLGATWRQALMGGVLISLGIYVVFQHALSINLAKGPWGF